MSYQIFSSPLIEEGRIIVCKDILFVKDRYIFIYQLKIGDIIKELREYFNKEIQNFITKYEVKA